VTPVRAVVIGVGNRCRGDDAIGPTVADRVDALGLPGVLCKFSDGEPAGLLTAWTAAPLAIVVDAVCCEPPTPGRIWRTTVDALPGVGTATSSHGLGLPTALALGLTLDRLPRDLIVIGVEAADVTLGQRLSEPVATAVPQVLRAVLDEVAGRGQRGRTTSTGTGEPWTTVELTEPSSIPANPPLPWLPTTTS
jgi:hydrogenase maturation protease